ncbi:hypothetical protein SAMN04488591_2650 [Microbacterium azadirachtae]|uniref:Uncharacterized protein n=1 Tax=Microbacterium azadirachtae TaxID=582680 RepID=A0A1I6IH01_9MICO|nr:hypothetical protein [Microbacterium azadirachtae]SFR66067.1 hypothetical protein SAMN04488591_2650 [Microbacterium azadirachtae]
MFADRAHAATARPDPPLASTDDPERGDVPGWVLITLMTAGLVVLIWAVAGPALTNLFEQAIARVSGL